MLFCEACAEQLRCIRWVLTCFELVSELKINLSGWWYVKGVERLTLSLGSKVATFLLHI